MEVPSDFTMMIVSWAKNMGRLCCVLQLRQHGL
jgi:hypothetical protein